MTPPPKTPPLRISIPFQLEPNDSGVFLPKPKWNFDVSGSSTFEVNSTIPLWFYSPTSSPPFAKMFTPKYNFGIPVSTTSTPSPAVWRKSDTGQFIIDFAMALDSIDVDLKGLPVNGGQKGCRFSEVVSKEKYDAGKETCKNHFEADTKADVHMEIRPVQGKTYSELHRFTALYDKFPGRTGNRINGFYLTHPVDKNDEGALSIERTDPFESGKDFRDPIKPSYDTPVGKPVAPSDLSSRLIMKPIGWLYDEGPGISFDISANMLKAWGLTKKEQFTSLDLEPFQLPRRLDKLLRFFPLPRPHDENFILADSCYDKLPGAEYIRPNSVNDLPSLIQWTNPETMSIVALFRKTSLSLGKFGHIDLGDKGVNRIKITGDKTKTVVQIELGDIPSFRFNQGGINIAGKGLKTGTVTLTLPSMEDISKEFGLLDAKKYADAVSDCEKKAALKAKAKSIAKTEGRNLTDVLDELEAEAAAEDKTPKKDHSTFIEKLIGNIQVDGISADELSLEQPSRGLKATFSDPKIKSAQIHGTKEIVFTGLESSKITLEDDSTKAKVVTGKSGIQEIRINRGEDGPKINLKGLDGKEISLTQDNGGIKFDSAYIGSLQLDISQKDKFQLNLQDAKSSGQVQFKNNKENYEFRTSGSSAIPSFELNYSKDLDGDKLNTKLKFSGAIKEVFLSNPMIGDLTMTDTVIGDSTFDLDLEFPTNEKPKTRFALGLDVQKAQLKEGHLKIAELGESSLTKGKIELQTGDEGLSGKISGELKLKINEVKIPASEAFLKGFSVDGSIKDVAIEGSGTLEISPELISLHKTADPEKPATLKVTGTVNKLVFRDDPSLRGSEVKGMPKGKVIKSEMTIDNAKVEVKDVENFEFVRPNAELGRKADLKKLKVDQISITDIQASAKLWAKFPVFGWLMGKFPEIGKLAGRLPDVAVSSEIRLGSLDTKNNGEGRTTQISDFLIQLFEVGGRTQKARFKLPSLTLSPKLITTGKDPIELELYFKDSDRGGDFEFKLEDEDLSKRKTHPAPP